MSSRRLRSQCWCVICGQLGYAKSAVEVPGDQQPTVSVLDVRPCVDPIVGVPGESVNLMANVHITDIETSSSDNDGKCLPDQVDSREPVQ